MLTWHLAGLHRVLDILKCSEPSSLGSIPKTLERLAKHHMKSLFI